MDVKNKNRIGYKKTKVGWIPEDWECKRFADISKVNQGLQIPIAQRHNAPSPTRGVYITVQYLNGGSEAEYIEGATESVSCTSSDVLMTRTGNTGIVVTDVAGVFHNNFFKINYDTDRVAKMFMVSFLRMPHTQHRIRGLAGSSTIPDLNHGDFYSISIPLPPLPEQEAIAGVLECWDKAIRNYEKKIEKKRNIKKGLMQKLLSGKQRLPGFSREWKKVVFGEVFELLKTYAFSREKLTLKPQESAEIYNIHYGDIHAIYTGYALDLEKERAVPLIKKATEIPSNPVLLQEGDLIIADVSEDYEGVGACVELRNIGSRKVTGGLHTFVARDKRGHSALGYRNFLLKHPAFAKRMKQISNGVSVHGISKGNLLKEKISLPPLHEQQAIAAVLSAADSEIEAMEIKLAILKDQKKFLLKNLVTGTIRLPQFKDGTASNSTDGENT